MQILPKIVSIIYMKCEKIDKKIIKILYTLNKSVDIQI